jgi:hypothetical protein
MRSDINVLSIDYDSTLVDTITPLLRYIKKVAKLSKLLSAKDIPSGGFLDKQFGAIVSEYFGPKHVRQAYNDTHPFPGAVAFIKNLQKHGFVIKIVTKNLNPQHERVKTQHCVQHFGIPKKQIVHVSQGEKHEHTQRTLLMDDSVHNVLSHAEHNIDPGVLFNYLSKHGWALPVDERPPYAYATTYGSAYHQILRLTGRLLK